MSVRYVALGDSTTYGLGDAQPDGSWRGFAGILADSLGASESFVNLAVCGARSATVRATQLAPAMAQRPQLASVIVGINDTMRSDFDPGVVREHVLAITGALAGLGALPLTVRLHDHGRIFGLPGVLARPLARRIAAVNDAFGEAHERFGGIRIDLTAEAWVYERASWSVDRLHPSELGHRRLVRAFAERLRAAGWTVSELPSLTCAVGVALDLAANVRWMLTQGMPWVGRRARDLVPWAVALAGREVSGQVARKVRRRRRGRGRIASTA